MSSKRSKTDVTADLVKLGLAPRLLDLGLAAAYVGLSTRSFLKGVTDKRYPAPLRDGKRQRWDRKALDAAVDRRSGLGATEETSDDLMRAIDAA